MENNKSGFTLVELAIVLVIIGLLIGGILVARSMINTSQIQSTTRQMAQFDSAVSNFGTKYNQLPGDSDIIIGGFSDNDGWLEDIPMPTAGSISNQTSCSPAAPVTTSMFSNEIGRFWHHLSLSGLKTTGTATQYTENLSAALTNITQAAFVNTYIPKAPIGTNLGYVVCSTAVNTSWYVLGALSIGASNEIIVTPSSGLRGSEAMALDTKIDDGIKDAGNVWGTQGVVTLEMDPSTPGTTQYTIGASDVANTTLFTRIGAQTGDLK